MHSSHGRSRRRGGNNDEAAMPLLTSRVDESRSETFSHLPQSSHHTESYRPPSTTARPYDMNREASSSHSHRDTDTSRSPYNYSKVVYHSDTREEYDGGEPRDSEVWTKRPTSNPQYTPSGGDRERNHSYSSRTEANFWATPPAHDNRTPDYDQWTPEDERGHGRPPERDTWGREERRDKGSSQRWRRDSGWGSRHNGNQAENRDKGRNSPVGWGALTDADFHAQSGDGKRSWEPAPKWQLSNHANAQAHRSHTGPRNHLNKNPKGGKKSYHGKQKRDWRNDDGNLNNWPKRDVHGSSSRLTRTPSKRRHSQSPSRSRSRSPAESYYSRGRSKSRSRSPKRQRRGSSPLAPRSRTPSDRGRNPRQDIKHAHSKSPISPRHSRDKRGSRRRSISSASSTSRSRSSSRSPVDRPRAVHRLPPATSIKDINMSPPKLTRATGMPPPRDIASHRNGRGPTNGNQADRTRRNSVNASLTEDSMPTRMPPPTSVPATSSRARKVDPISTTSLRSEPPHSHPDPTPRSSIKEQRRVKNAGFRPIGQPNLAVKKFFPGDDDDLDLMNDRRPRSSTPTQTSQEFIHETEPSKREDDRPLGARTVEQYDAASEISLTRRESDEPSVRRLDVHESRLAASGSPRESQLRRLSLQDDEGSRPAIRNDEGHPGRTTPTQRIPERDVNDHARPQTPSRGSRSELYAIVSQVGEGTFGKVYKARNTVTKLYVALKRIRMEAERDGFPVTAMREIKLLQSLRHANVVRLYEMMVSNGSVYMVFEYMDHDLTGVLSQTQFSFTDANLKSLCQQMLAGLAYLHHKGVIHRDIKGSNILVNNRGELKLADFGLARFYQKRRRTDYTNRVITLWYRPPELLFGATVYGPEVDMWSAGCIMLELFTKKPVFQGNDEIHQLDVIYKVIGTPTLERWAGITDLPWYELVKPKDIIHNHFRELFKKWLSPAALDLAEQLLAYNPTQRVTALQAMSTPYFTREEPQPAPPVGLSTLEGEWHELETKRERAKKRRKTEPGMQ